MLLILKWFYPEFRDSPTMTKSLLQVPNDDRAWSQRGTAAFSTRRWASAWQCFLMLVVALVVIGAFAGIVLLLAGDLRVDLSPQSSVLLFALVTVLGGAISVIVRRIQTLRSDERTHLEAMSEGQVQEHVWQLGLQTKDVALMREMASAGEALNRGTAIPGTLTNQHLEQARLEAKLASAPSANPLSPATALLQDALSRRSNRTPQS
jgi:hypothetical protein